MRSSRELAHAVLMPGFAGTTAPDWLLKAVDSGLGGVCYFGHNIESPEQIAALSAELHAAGSVLLSIDEEGGIVTRLHVRSGSAHVGAATLGRADDTELTGQVAGLIAEDVRAAGIDLDLAPVADVNSDPANPVIGVRSFGADPALVSRHTRAFVTAVQAHGVAACAKHFPGHGDTHVDSHIGLPTVDVDLEILRARELVPFVAAIEAGVRCVMTAHAVYPALDTLPATLSAPVIDLLRHDLGFDGVVISDAIDMQAISGTVGFDEGVVRALLAGVDLVGLGNPVLNVTSLGDTLHENDEREFQDALDAVLDAVDNGRLSLERLSEAADRVHALRAWLKIGAEATRAESPDDWAARAALRIRGDITLSGRVHVVDVRRRRNIASGRLTSLLADELLSRIPGSTTEAVFASVGAAEGRATVADLQAGSELSVRRPDVIVTGTPGQDDAEQNALERLLRKHPDAVVVCLGWSSNEADIPSARNAVFTFGDSRPTAHAAADALTS